MVMSAAFSGAKAQSYNTPQEVYNRLHEGFPALRSQVVRPAKGFIRHPYLVPAGFYSQLWDWTLSLWLIILSRVVSRNI